MKDWQVFDERSLPNGIRIFEKRYDTSQTHIAVEVPVGSANNTGRFIPGTFHFLEHMLMLRSRRHPGLHEFKRHVEVLGGNVNAGIGPFRTNYEMTIPSKHLTTMLPGFMSLIFEPLFGDEGAVRQRGIIASERQRYAQWYPSRSELGHYLCTKWKWAVPLSLRQVLGDDEDLVQMTQQYLMEAHDCYFDPRVRIVVAGSGDASALFEAVGNFQVAEHDLPQTFTPMHWVRQEFHEHCFRELQRFELWFGGITVWRPEAMLSAGLTFGLKYLDNRFRDWLRDDKGWVYEVSTEHVLNEQNLDWAMCIPLRSREQIGEVRDSFYERMQSAFNDTDAISREVDGLQNRINAVDCPPPALLVQGAQQSLSIYGRIIPDTEFFGNLERMRTGEFLQRIWREHSTPECTGCFCAVPQDA